MLRTLSIKNYAIIDQLNLDLSHHLNIITGETGAGKSIILGALSLILGKRADHSVLYNKEQKCIVEGTFELKSLNLSYWFKEQELDYEDECVIRREINSRGKSRAFINDTPVTLHILKELSDQLIDLHQQHETLEVNEAAFRFNVLDSLAAQTHILTDYQRRFKELKRKKDQLNNWITKKQQQSADLDYWQFQLNELQEAKLEEGELDRLKQQVKRLEHLGAITEAVQQAAEAIDGDQSALQLIHQALAALRQGEKFESDLEPLSKRLESLEIELRDISSEISNYSIEESVQNGSPVEMNLRLDLLQRLMMKHQADTESELLQTMENIQSKVSDVDTADEQIAALEELIKSEEANLHETADALSQARMSSAAIAEEQIRELLAKVGMPGAEFKVAHEVLSDLNLYGKDHILFTFSSNKGSALQELKKVASGGELSRLMLCIKTLIAGSMALPSLIFDEIDSGISGETAVKVGKLLKKLAAEHQIICITHLPQIAGKGEKHYFVYKEDTENRTLTAVRELNQNDRIMEIAKMLSGDQPTEAALTNARELLLN